MTSLCRRRIAPLRSSTPAFSWLQSVTKTLLTFIVAFAFILHAIVHGRYIYIYTMHISIIDALLNVKNLHKYLAIITLSTVLMYSISFDETSSARSTRLGSARSAKQTINRSGQTRCTCTELRYIGVQAKYVAVSGLRRTSTVDNMLITAPPAGPGLMFDHYDHGARSGVVRPSASRPPSLSRTTGNLDNGVRTDSER
jgi:hypothetical protein